MILVRHVSSSKNAISEKVDFFSRSSLLTHISTLLMSRVCQVYLAPRQSSDPLPDRETFSGEPIHVEPLAAQEHKSLLIEGCWHQVVAPWRVYVCVGTRPLMNVDVILRVARKMFTVSIYCLLIGMNPASPLLQGRAEPKNDLPVFCRDLTKGVYIYIFSG